MRSIWMVIVVLGLAVAVVAVARAVGGPSETVVQPIAFNHKIHLEDAQLQCLQCHTDAATRVWAGLPGKEVCLDCHDPDDDETAQEPEKAKLVAFADADQDIPWRRVAVLRPDVFFSHRRHVTSAGIDCLRCHPGQPALTEPPSTASLVMRMDDCIACHEANDISTDCLACHR
ncbi:MAG: cytochrome c3 family protein [Phycisphaerae bacterium]